MSKGILDRLAQLARKVPWVRVVIVVMLVLPVLLVILAYLDQLDPKAQQVLRNFLQRLFPRLLPAPASGTATPSPASPLVTPLWYGRSRFMLVPILKHWS